MTINFLLEKYLAIFTLKALLKMFKDELTTKGASNLLHRAGALMKTFYRRRIVSKNAGAPMPSIVVVSVNSRCNLNCEGCFVIKDKRELSGEMIHTALQKIKKMGVSFCFIIGGEPTLNKEIFKYIHMHPEMIFLLFTNGTIHSAIEKLCQEHPHNLLFVFSVEGSEDKTDHRRGRGVYRKVLESMEICRKYNAPFGFSVTAADSNIDSIRSDEFLEEMQNVGCSMGVFFEYSKTNSGLQIGKMSLTEENRDAFRSSMNIQRKFMNIPIAILPGDEIMMGGCQYGKGLIYISTNGDVHLCPFSQQAFSHINRDLIEDLRRLSHQRFLGMSSATRQKALPCTESSILSYKPNPLNPEPGPTRCPIIM